MLRTLREGPVTFASLVVLATVFAGTHGIVGDDAQRLSQWQRNWGAAVPLTWVSITGEHAEVADADLHGPFDLWSGEWWRVPASALHHVDFWHLLLNMLATTVWGRLLEQAWGSCRYFGFLLGAALVSALPEYMLGDYALGYSGVGCALLGALIVVRHSHPPSAGALNDVTVAIALLVLVGMWLATEAGVLQIANLAHFTGLAYGWMIATLWSGPWLVRWSLVAAHALLIVPYWAVTHPTWNGRYHWYRAGLTTSGELARREDPAQLQRAVQCDPTLAGAWLLLADAAARHDRPLEAWRLTLHALRYQPTSTAVWTAARQHWRRWTISPERPAAIASLNELFGADASAVLAELRRVRPPPVLIAPNRPIGPRPEMLAAPPETVAWQASPLETWRALTSDHPAEPVFNPNDPHSAVEGERL